MAWRLIIFAISLIVSFVLVLVFAFDNERRSNPDYSGKRPHFRSKLNCTLEFLDFDDLVSSSNLYV
jgi:hypothetical protein